jgi:signal peptidase I
MEQEISLKKIVRKLSALIISALALAVVGALDIFQMQFINPVFILISVIISLVAAFISIAFKYFQLSKKQKYNYYETIDFLFMLNLALLFVQLFFAIGFYPAKVQQRSMENTLFNGDKLIVQRLGTPQNFDIVILKIDETINGEVPEDDEYIVKRVIGGPGDTFYFDEYGFLYLNGIRQEETYLKDESGNFLTGRDHFRSESLHDLAKINGQKVPIDVIPDDYYFVLGDNRSNSIDSEDLGLFHKSQIMGIAKWKRVGFLDWKAL